jgi:DNA-binding CsgD family transcriptional regulator
MKLDAISIVEAAYDLDGDTAAWLSRLVECVAPRLDRGFGVSASTYDPSQTGWGAWVFNGFVPEVVAATMASMKAMARVVPDLNRRLYTFAAPFANASQNLGLTMEEAAVFPPFAKHMHAFGIRDAIGVGAVDPDGQAVVLSALTADLRRPSRQEIATWARIAAHVAAGARLRRAFHVAPALAEGGEAILSPSGHVAHAEASAKAPGARASLRDAAKAIDRARSKARHSEDEALDLWRGLVSGRWSLVDRFDSDGRRFLVAHKNDPQMSDPRALTLGERQVLAYVAMGRPLKLIAYALGLSLGTVSHRRSKAMKKLGLRTQAEVAQLFSAPPAAERPLSGVARPPDGNDEL